MAEPSERVDQRQHHAYLQAFAHRLRNARLTAGLSVRQVVVRFKTPLFLSEYEAARRLPPLHQLAELAKHYGADARGWLREAASDAGYTDADLTPLDQLWATVLLYESARAWAGRQAYEPVST